jgi:hypothetical protein
VRQTELLARLHALQLYLPVAAPHYAALLLNYLLGVLHYVRVTALPQLDAVLAAALPLLGMCVREFCAGDRRADTRMQSGVARAGLHGAGAGALARRRPAVPVGRFW